MAKNIIPVLPLRDIVVFPNMVAPLFVGREQSVNALNHVMTGDKKIFLLSQKNSKVDNPNKENLYSVGTIAKIIQLLKLPDGTLKVLVEGIQRAKINKSTLRRTAMPIIGKNKTHRQKHYRSHSALCEIRRAKQAMPKIRSVKVNVGQRQLQGFHGQ